MTRNMEFPHWINEVTSSEGAKVSLLEYTDYAERANDWSVAINKAIDEVATISKSVGGGIVEIPANFRDGFVIRDSIKLKSRVTLQGMGPHSSLILGGWTNKDMIILDNPNVELTCVRNLRLRGSKDTQTAGHGIHYDNRGGTGFSWYDQLHVLENVIIMTTKESGVRTETNDRSSFMSNVYVNGSDAYGFDINNTDALFEGCTTGNIGWSGFRIAGANNRFSGCKAFGSGRLNVPGNGSGFFLQGSGRHQFAICESQDNAFHGFLIQASNDNTFVGCNADSNGKKGTGNGFRLAGGSTNNKICAVAEDRYATEGAATQRYAMEITDDCFGNKVDIISRQQVSGHFVGTGYGNDISINMQNGVQKVTATSIIEPIPYDGGTMFIEQDKNITFTAVTGNKKHPGLKMTIILKQDATGGRTIGFQSGYKVGAYTPNTQAGKTNIIEFLFDGTDWVLIGSSVV